MKDNRSPVIVELMYSIQWYLLTMSVVTAFAHWLLDDPTGFCQRALIVPVAYLGIALVMRFVKISVLRVIVLPVVVIGCIMLGRTAGECVLFGVLGAMAVVCGLLLYFFSFVDSRLYGDMFFYSAILALVAFMTWRFDTVDATRWITAFSIIYLPLCVATWYIDRLSNSLSIFKGRPDQPVRHINKRMGGFIVGLAILILAVSVVLPQFYGGSFITDVFELIKMGIGLFFLALINLMPSCLEDNATSMPMEPILETEEQSAGDSKFLYVLFVLLVAGFVVWLIITLIKALRRLFSGLMKERVYEKKDERSRYDVVEKIQRPRAERAEKTEGKTNASVIRRIYRKRVRGILGKDDILRASLTPAEINALCKKKGEDISTLTELYRKARYTNNCTAQDVEAARKV